MLVGTKSAFSGRSAAPVRGLAQRPPWHPDPDCLACDMDFGFFCDVEWVLKGQKVAFARDMSGCKGKREIIIKKKWPWKGRPLVFHTCRTYES